MKPQIFGNPIEPMPSPNMEKLEFTPMDHGSPSSINVAKYIVGPAEAVVYTRRASMTEQGYQYYVAAVKPQDDASKPGDDYSRLYTAADLRRIVPELQHAPVFDGNENFFGPLSPDQAAAVHKIIIGMAIGNYARQMECEAGDVLRLSAPEVPAAPIPFSRKAQPAHVPVC